MKWGDTADAFCKLFGEAQLVKGLAVFFTSIASYFLPTEQMRGAAIGAFMLVILDTVTGFAAASKSGVPISSARASRVLSKLVAYGSVVIVAAVLTRNVPGMSEYQQFGVMASLTLVIITESISILENAASLGVPLPKGLLDMLRGRIGNGSKEKQ